MALEFVLKSKSGMQLPCGLGIFAPIRYVCARVLSVFGLLDMMRLKKASNLFYYVSTHVLGILLPILLDCFDFHSAPFAETRWTSRRLNTRQILLPPTITDCQSLLVIADTCFIWIVFNDGSKLDPCARCVIRNGTLPKLNVFRDMVSWESKPARNTAICHGCRHWILLLDRRLLTRIST